MLGNEKWGYRITSLEQYFEAESYGDAIWKAKILSKNNKGHGEGAVVCVQCDHKTKFIVINNNIYKHIN